MQGLGIIQADRTAVMVCDLQEKFAPSILHFETIVLNTERVVKCAQCLQIPVLVTEQYPKVNQQRQHEGYFTYLSKAKFLGFRINRRAFKDHSFGWRDPSGSSGQD